MRREVGGGRGEGGVFKGKGAGGALCCRIDRRIGREDIMGQATGVFPPQKQLCCTLLTRRVHEVIHVIVASPALVPKRSRSHVLLPKSPLLVPVLPLLALSLPVYTAQCFDPLFANDSATLAGQRVCYRSHPQSLRRRNKVIWSCS